MTTGAETLTLVHKGNIMKFTEGAFRTWGYEVARDEFGATDLDGGPWQVIKTDDGHEITVNDVIADAMLQQILTRPKSYDVIATMNLNGDYISDALAAQVGGIGIAPGANINYDTGQAIFEATHGTAPKYAGQDKVNPSSVILSGEMMFRYMGWTEAADLLISSMDKTIIAEARDLRLRAADGRRDAAQDERVRRRPHREHGVAPFERCNACAAVGRGQGAPVPPRALLTPQTSTT